MISIGKATNSGYSKHVQDSSENGAAEYYAGENVPSNWTGALAAQQGLSGEVTKDDLVDALNGHVKDATGDRVLSEEREGRIAAYDVTISAPKSVSVEALVYGNEAALDAHREAVQATVEKLESGIGTRVTRDGKTEHENTGNAQIAQFEHHMSASGDPHLHTHNVVMNATIAEDGKARAVDAKESIFGQSGELAKTYNDALEAGLNKRGLETTRDEKGNVQLAGYDKNGMREFSERQQAMDANLKERGSSYDAASAAERELARQETRKEVEQPGMRNRDEAQRDWRETADQARAKGAEVGPARQMENEAGKGERNEQNTERKQASREEFREAKWVVNEGKAAEQRLESGNYRSDEHRQQLEQRVERMEQLKQADPELYARAEKSVEKMGVRDPDAKIDAATAERVKDAPAQKADRDAGELNTAKWTVGKAKDAQEQLSAGVRDAEYRKKLEGVIDKAEQLKRQDPRLHARADQAWNDEMTRAKRVIGNAQAAEKDLTKGKVHSAQHREELERFLAHGRELQSERRALYAMAEKSIRREEQKVEHGEKGSGQAARPAPERSGRFAEQEPTSKASRRPDLPIAAEKGKLGANVAMLRDADLAARALKSDSGLFLGIGKRELSAKDKSQMDRVYNSRGDQFFVDKKGNVYSGLLNAKDPGAYFKEQKSLFGVGRKEYLVTEKGDVFVRGKGLAGGIAQRFANSLKSDEKGLAARVWNRSVQDMIGAKWEKATGGEARKVLKEANQARKEHYNSRIELRHALQQDVKEAVAAISQRPRDMAKAYNALEDRGKTVKLTAKAAKQIEEARSELRRATGSDTSARAEQKGVERVDQAAKDTAKSAASGAAMAITAAADKAKDPEQAKREADKARVEKNEREAIKENVRLAGGASIDAADAGRVAAIVQQASKGRRQEVEAAVKDALASGKVSGKDAAEYAQMKVTELAGGDSVQRQMQDKLEKTVARGKTANTEDLVRQAEAAKSKLDEIKADERTARRQQESAAMRDLIEKYGSADQKKELGMIDQKVNPDYRTAEEKEREKQDKERAFYK